PPGASPGSTPAGRGGAEAGRAGSRTGVAAGREAGASASSPRRRRSTTLKPGSDSRSDTDAPPQVRARGRARGSDFDASTAGCAGQAAEDQDTPMLYWPRPAGGRAVAIPQSAHDGAVDVEPGRRPAFH